MRKILTIILLTICFAFFANNSYAQKTKSRIAKTQAAAQKKVDLGNLSGNTYTNDFFELKLEFPYGWLVGDNVLEAQLQQITQAQIQAKDARSQKTLNRAIDRVTPLLGGYKKLPGTPENANLRVVVEDLSPLPQIKNGKYYLARLLASLKLIKMPSTVSYSEVKNETINGNSLDYIEAVSGSAKKRIYTVIRKGFAVLISIDYYEDADFNALHKVLTEADLNYKK